MNWINLLTLVIQALVIARLAQLRMLSRPRTNSGAFICRENVMTNWDGRGIQFRETE